MKSKWIGGPVEIEVSQACGTCGAWSHSGGPSIWQLATGPFHLNFKWRGYFSFYVDAKQNSMYRSSWCYTIENVWAHSCWIIICLITFICVYDIWPDPKILEKFPSDSSEQQALITAIQNDDGYNWGYAPSDWFTLSLEANLCWLNFLFLFILIFLILCLKVQPCSLGGP